MHRIFNYGSSLQAFSLHKILGELAPQAKVSYVDYRPGLPLVNVATSGESRNRLLRTAAKVRTYATSGASTIDTLRFINHKRSYSRKYFPLIGLQETVDYETDLDLQVIGSDEVFNCVQSNANVGYSRDLFGIGSRSKSVISYAASFGNTTIDKIREYGLVKELRNAFEAFSHLSVRDANSAEIIQELTGIRARIHVDPTFVVDLMTHSETPDSKFMHDPYLLVYAYPGRLSLEENNFIRRYAKHNHLKVLCFGGAQPCGDRFVDCSPFELLGYFRKASVVVTDTFHGSIFSVLAERRFATITRHSQGTGYGNLEKIGYLLDKLDLRSRELTNINDLRITLEPGIDYARVRGIIAEERLRSREYLTTAVEPLVREASKFQP